jgi:ABC-2 type transport system ATP-binding protein
LQTEYAIQTVNLTKTFKSKIPNTSRFSRKTRSVNAIDNLNLAIKKGELFGLLGPNGAGKTTLVKMLCTLLPPDQGSATVNGYDIVKQQMEVKQSLGTLFSVGERGFFWRLNGYRNLEFFAAIYNVPRQKRHDRILEVLKLVGLEKNTYDLYQKYSGGMKRKLALARTLLPDPPILLLDEPTTGLDATSSKNIREFIQTTVKETDKTVLYTTHYIEEAAQICTKIGILSRGSIIAQDTPNALRDKIKKVEQIHLTVEDISSQQIEKIRNLQGVTNLTENSQDLLANQTGLFIQIQNINQLSQIFTYLFEQKIKLVNLKHQEPTLEDAFIELTKRAQP